MSSTTWLIDESAMVRLGASPDAEQWANRIQRRLVHICTVTLLEVGYSARTAHDLTQGRRTPPLSAMPLKYSTPAIEDRALDVQRQLANVDSSAHRRSRIYSLPRPRRSATESFCTSTMTSN